MLIPSLQQFDITLFYLLNGLPHNHLADTLASILHYGTRSGFVYYPLLLILVMLRATRKRGLVVLAVVLVRFSVMSLILKPLIHRPRPYTVLSHVHLVPPLPQTFSFPSGETAAAFALATICNLLFPGKAWRLLWLWALFVACDRVYMGHHYPSDIAAGALLGIVIAYLVSWITRKYDLTRGLE